MNTTKVFIDSDFGDAVPIISSFIVLHQERFPPSKESVNWMLDEVSQCVGDSMERDCKNCGVDMTDCGVLVEMDEEFNLSCSSICVDCLEEMAIDTEILDMDDLQRMTSELERFRMQ